MAVQLTVFDGSGCIGGNKIYLLADGVGVFFDFGLNFSARSRYFDEFLRPRSALGLLDYLKTGLLPPIPGIYRHDLFPPGAKRMEGFGLKEDDPLQLQAVHYPMHTAIICNDLFLHPISRFTPVSPRP